MMKCRYCTNQATAKVKVTAVHYVDVCQQCYDDIEFNKSAPIKYYYVLINEDGILWPLQVFYNKTQAQHYADTTCPEMSLRVVTVML